MKTRDIRDAYSPCPANLTGQLDACRNQQANDQANIIAIRRLPDGQPQQRVWRGG
jgi:hypothetical protein